MTDPTPDPTPDPIAHRVEGGHWLVFNERRVVGGPVVGCHCGFVAELDADAGWGDSVLDHFETVVRAETADEVRALRAENQRLRATLIDVHAEGVRQIQGTADDMVASGARAIKAALADINEKLVQPLLTERDALAAELAAARDQIAAETARKIAAFSSWLESTPSYQGISAEAVVWRRIGKVGEEFGEVMEAWLGAIGENPRKGITGCADEVVHELLDVATTALGAVEHFNGHSGEALQMLAEHVDFIYDRAGLAALSQSGQPTKGEPA